MLKTCKAKCFVGDFFIFSTFMLIMKPIKKFSHKIFFHVWKHAKHFPHTTKHKMETKYFFIQMFSLVKIFFTVGELHIFFICENTWRKKKSCMFVFCRKCSSFVWILFYLFYFFPLEYFCVYLWNQLKSLANEFFLFCFFLNAKHCSTWYMWHQMETIHLWKNFYLLTKIKKSENIFFFTVEFLFFTLQPTSSSFFFSSVKTYENFFIFENR